MASSRQVTMDPPHITEFASERYFEKLSQLNAQQQQQHSQQLQLQQQEQQQQSLDSHAATSTTAVVSIPSSSSTFILPLRESKLADIPTVKAADSKRDKSRFFSIRHKVSLLHSKSTHSELETPPTATVVVPQVRSSTDSTRKSLPLDQLFLALPNELQIQIISSLPLTDVLNLRLASRFWHGLISANEATIVRYHLDQHIPAYALRLYPVADASEVNFHYLCSLWHRLHVAAKLAFLMCEWITKEIFLRQSDAQRMAFAPQHERMRRRLIPLLFTVFHFFETYRKLHLEHLAKTDGRGLKREPYTLNPIEREIMNMYDDQTLLRVHEAFPLVISSFCRRLRPPTYVGRVERSLRGYLREKPSDDVHVAILCLGGLRQVERLWEIKGYNNRRSAVDVWYNSLTKESPTPFETSPVKSRRGLMNFGRKKSTSGSVGGEREPHRGSFSESLYRTRSPHGSIDHGSLMSFEIHGVFNTSLSAGAPMSPLSIENCQSILDDLPVLQQIWLTTAEAMIMDRKIVERTQDIKRNQQVMLDLISEDGIYREDEWWYGRNIPESVRPPIIATEEDAD